MQAKLIPAHVTLCREDEVSDWVGLECRALAIAPIEVAIAFGSPLREGNLVYLPAVGSTADFDQLRHALLARDGKAPRKHAPHITIIHPRNGVCTDSMFAEISSRVVPFTATFREISLIKQQDGGSWERFAVLGP